MAPIVLNGSFVIFNMLLIPFFNKHKEQLEKLEKRLEDEMTGKFQELNKLVINSVLKATIQDKIQEKLSE